MCICVCVCPSAGMSPELHARYMPIFNAFCVLPWLCSVLLRQGDENSREVAILGVFFPSGNALYSIAFGTHIKTAKPMEMPFGMISRLGPRNNVLRGVTIPKGEGAIFGENMCLTSLTPYELRIGLVHAAGAYDRADA